MHTIVYSQYNVL